MVANQVKFISTAHLRQCGISPLQCIQWVEESFKLKYAAELPPKMGIHPQGEDFFNTMPALLPPEYGRFGVKVVSRIAEQTPALKSDILLYDSRTGDLLALFDGDWITAMRTGAVAALAVRTFKRSDTDTYSLVGLGNTARATALCLLADHPDTMVRFRLMRYKDQAERFVERFKDEPRARFEIIDSMEEFIAEASVIISCVTSAHGLFCSDDSLYQKGVLVVPVHTRGFQNCDLSFDKVFGDDTAHICGFKYFSQFRQYDEFSKVLLGENPGRENDQERILSYNMGLGLHDALFASKIYDLVENTTCELVERERENDKFWV